ncbi:MAG: aminotransferase class I/II-fold pyridoxal phosphate-dependent enzyme [Oscillospiraceae bacterium]
MDTPIYDFLRKYAVSDTLRLHMPGHKGRKNGEPLSEIFPYDITEIFGADSLFDAEGIIAESEKNAAKLFNTAKTIYSTGGSTLCIQTMLALAAPEKSTVIAARNAHKAFLNACVLLDLDVSWIFPDSDNNVTFLSYKFSAKAVEDAILAAKNPSCVYVTSPDYYGGVVDISAISAVCKRHNLPLLVDNAHGAYLAFLPKNQHPIALGADLCCDSAHKTLPVLTGGAYLHINNEKFASNAKTTMGLFGSTSPSYLTLGSLDLCNNFLENCSECLAGAVLNISNLKKSLGKFYTICESDSLRITILSIDSGLTGNQLAEILRKNCIECEYSDENCVVLLFSPINTAADCERVLQVLSTVKMPKIAISAQKLALPHPQKAMTIRKAALSENEEIPISQATGRICGKTKILCPPGVPIVASGEIIDEDCIKILKKYSIFTINVVK